MLDLGTWLALLLRLVGVVCDEVWSGRNMSSVWCCRVVFGAAFAAGAVC